VLNGNTVCNDNETLTGPTSVSGADEFHRELRREVAKERGSASRGTRSGFGLAGGPTVESTDPKKMAKCERRWGELADVRYRDRKGTLVG
jgi:hypothetical protein